MEETLQQATHFKKKKKKNQKELQASGISEFHSVFQDHFNQHSEKHSFSECYSRQMQDFSTQIYT